MISLPLEYGYNVGYMPPRAQKARYMPMRGSMVLEFEELDPASTQHVANITERKKWIYSHDRYARADKDEKVRVLVSDGSFWREDSSLEKLVRQVAAANIENGHLCHIGTTSTHSSECGDVGDLTNEQRVSKVLAYVPRDRWEDDGGAHVAEQFRRKARQMAVFDGGVFVRTQMPVIGLSKYSSRGLGIVSARAYGPGEDVHHQEHLCFDIDELDRALAFQRQIGTDGEDVSETLEIEILQPGIWDAATHRDAVIGIAKQALEAVMTNTERAWVDLLDKGYDLRDALIECAGEVTPMLLQVLEDIAALQPPSEDMTAEWKLQAEQYRDGWHKGRSKLLADHSLQDHAAVTGLASKALLRWQVRKPDASWEEHVEGAPVLFDDRGSAQQILTMAEARVLERIHGIDLSSEIAGCLEGRTRLHAVAWGLGGVDLKRSSPHALVAEESDGLRLVASTPDADLDRIAGVVADLMGRPLPAPAPSMAPGGVR